MWLAWTLSIVLLLGDKMFCNGIYAAAVYTSSDTSSSNSSHYTSPASGIDYSKGVSLGVAFTYSHQGAAPHEDASPSRVAPPAATTNKRALPPQQQSPGHPWWATNIRAESSGGASEASVNASERGMDDGPPGADTDPHGFTIYNSLEQVPTARLLWRASKLAKCYTTRTRRSHCWTAYVCGHRCEPVLLAINSFCRRLEPHCSSGATADGHVSAATTGDDGRAHGEEDDCSQHGRWIRCQKPRKFRRCYARVCFRKRGASKAGSRPMSYEDPLSISIVRYHRPQPKHDLFAKRTRPGGSQSAVYR